MTWPSQLSLRKHNQQTFLFAVSNHCLNGLTSIGGDTKDHLTLKESTSYENQNKVNRQQQLGETDSIQRKENFKDIINNLGI